MNKLIAEMTLPISPSINHLYLQKGKMRFMTKEGKRCKELIETIARSLKMPSPSLSNLKVELDYYFEKNNRDLLNSSKVEMDTLQGIIFENDRQIKEATLRMFKDKDNPRCEVRIYEICS